MKQTFVPCDDPLAGMLGSLDPKSDSTAAKKKHAAAKRETKKTIARSTSSPGSFSNHFDDALWLQNEHIRMPVPKRDSGSKKVKPKPKTPLPPKPTKSPKDIPLDQQLMDDITIAPDGDIKFIVGEDELMRLHDKVVWPHTTGLLELRGRDMEIDDKERIKLKGRGTFVQTNYRLYFLRRKTKDMYHLDRMSHIPLGEIERIDVKENRYRRKGQPPLWLEIGCKGVRVVRFGFLDENECEKARQLLCAFVFTDVEFAFSFAYELTKPIPPGGDGWHIYNPIQEYKRLGLPDTSFRLSEVNQEYKMCSSYPKIFMVPSTISDEDLHSIAKFRSRGRIPVLTWRCKKSGATVWRCSQPRVGLFARNKSDEELLSRIQELNGGKKLIIFDARPLKNALANKAVGKGFEESSYYKNSEVQFMNIENIHRVRESYQQARQAVIGAGKKWDGRFRTRFEGSGWLKHIRVILKATFEMVARVDMQQASILSHCSDGWDRTAQLISNTELCLDGYFRTIEGFCCLIEKEWLSYGHQFHKRIGHMKQVGDQDISPIFIQWLETVWQILQQYPTAFEFNSRMLLTIAHHTTSLRFGTFLYDTEQLRREKKIPKRTVSLWTYLRCSPTALQGRFTNPFYSPKKDLVLYPTWDNLHVSIWGDYWFQHCYSSSSHSILKMLPPHGAHLDQMPAPPTSLTPLEDIAWSLRKQLKDERDKKIRAEQRFAKLKKQLLTLHEGKILNSKGIEEILDEKETDDKEEKQATLPKKSDTQPEPNTKGQSNGSDFGATDDKKPKSDSSAADDKKPKSDSSAADVKKPKSDSSAADVKKPIPGVPQESPVSTDAKLEDGESMIGDLETDLEPDPEPKSEIEPELEIGS
ncbi:hypothetical protein AAMO2058_000946200 [Amorphochlora amoebiformis]